MSSPDRPVQHGVYTDSSMPTGTDYKHCVWSEYCVMTIVCIRTQDGNGLYILF